MIPCALSGHFVASLHSNFVVSLDFEGSASATGGDVANDEEASKSADDYKVMSFAGGERKFKCRLPNRTDGGGAPTDSKNPKTHFLSAKLAPLRGLCWKMKRDYWSYDVCFGRKITQYRPDAEARFSLGEHVPAADELFSNGSVREVYLGGTDNRSTEILYVCGSSESSSRVFTIEETQTLFYTVIVSGPAFCSWREKNGTQARDSEGSILKVSSLLEELRSSCINVTEGWWTYEYCYPMSLQQFHLGGTSGKKRDPEHSIGTLVGTNGITAKDEVVMDLVRLKPSISPRERRAPPSNHATLRQKLGHGTVCDETGRPRQVAMHFQCPPTWQQRPETRIISINEASICDYEVLIHTTLICGHHKFMPTLPRGKQLIQCAAGN